MPALVSYVCDPRPRDLILLLRSTVHRFLRRVQARNLCRPCCQLPSSSSTCRRHCASSSRRQASRQRDSALCGPPARALLACAVLPSAIARPFLGAGQLQLLALLLSTRSNSSRNDSATQRQPAAPHLRAQRLQDAKAAAVSVEFAATHDYPGLARSAWLGFLSFAGCLTSCLLQQKASMLQKHNSHHVRQLQRMLPR